MLAQAPQRKYRIERYLAEGGMGAIYIGKKLGAGGFEKEVVLKQLLPEFTERPEFRDLFFREAKISASLDHTNIVRTFDLVSSDDSLFIVMEYVRGADLRTISWRARIKRRPLSPRTVIHVALEILSGLAYAHGRRAQSGAPLGIIHRDVSPSNILCSGQGDVKLSDFGIAKATTFSSVFYRVRGKVGYMSPEQAQNKSLDARSDLFSLAVCLFETFTGERLFAGDLQTPPELIYGQEIPSLQAKRPDLPPEMDVVMKKALAREPDDRFHDARAFAEALRDLARRHGLLFSAPQLAGELRELLGADPSAWSHDETFATDSDKLPLARTLEGREATSLGIMDSPGAEGPFERENTVSLRPHRTPTLQSIDAPVVPVQADASAGPPVSPVGSVPSIGVSSSVAAVPLGASVLATLPRTPTPSMPPPLRLPKSPWRRGAIVVAYIALVGAGVAFGVFWAQHRAGAGAIGAEAGATSIDDR